MANWDATIKNLDNVYNGVSDAQAHKNKTYNTIKVESAGIKLLLKSNKDNDAKIKGLKPNIETKFKTLHTGIDAFVKAQEENHGTVKTNLMNAYSSWRKIVTETPTLK